MEHTTASTSAVAANEHEMRGEYFFSFIRVLIFGF